MVIAVNHQEKLQELDVNPLIVMDNGVVAADAYISMIIPIKN
jgi:succinyl-CoA synthetase beta subunit